MVDDLPAPSKPEEAPFTALVFKSASDQKFGHLSYIQVYSGELKPDETVWNPREAKREPVSHVYQMHAIQSAMAGCPIQQNPILTSATIFRDFLKKDIFGFARYLGMRYF